MISFVRLFMIGGIALGVCIIPDKATCKPCPVEAGTECVIDGKEKPCFTNLNSCCGDGSITVELDECLDVSCQRYAAITEEFSNEKCQTMCKEGESGSKEFRANCSYEHYSTKNGKVVLAEEGCYNNWVHGYSEEDTKAGYAIINGVSTPAMCQMECQKDPECARFLWTSELIGGTQYDKKFRCALKNADQVAGAYGEYWPVDGSTVNGNKLYCSPSAKQLCMMMGRTCLKCNDEEITRCVFPTNAHISGNPHCSTTSVCPAMGNMYEGESSADKPAEAPKKAKKSSKLF